jgi:hypothetical protein
VFALLRQLIPHPRDLSTSIKELHGELLSLKAWAFPRIDSGFVSGLRSEFPSAFPAVFGEFNGKRFSLLWRGSRDGFGAVEFHRRCDGKPNTLTIILDTEGNVFGGFTPLQWESRKWNGKRGDENNCNKADESLRSFLFTLKNPQNTPSHKFPLKPDKKFQAICCNEDWCPCFTDIGVYNHSDVNVSSYATGLGTTDANLVKVSPKMVFTSLGHFQVSEVEVFEITE